MNKITILGHTFEINFNMAVEVEYEELSGQPFDIEKMNTQKATMQLCYAALKVADNKIPFTFDEFIKKISFRETAELKDAVIQTMNEWLFIPAVMAEGEQQQTDGDEQKNA